MRVPLVQGTLVLVCLWSPCVVHATRVPTDSEVGSVYAFEYNPGENAVVAKPGWPMLLPEVAREPVLCRLGEGEQYSLVVQCQDGWLHVFDLPVRESPASDLDGWISYGADRGNTRGREEPCSLLRKGAELGDGPVAVRGVVPNPGKRNFEIHLSGPVRGEIAVEVFDATGRVVRRLWSDASVVDRTVVRWDGHHDRGHDVPSGAYWCGIAGEGRLSRRKLVVVK